MTRKTPPINVAASVHARLLKHAKEHAEDFNFVLTRYGIERLLYRLSRSDAAERFVLKGAMLFSIWSTERHRATHDVDLLSGGPPDLEGLAEVFRTVCQTAVEEDGVIFDSESVKAARIREDEEYQGVRLTLCGHLGRARLEVQVDVGFGDAITPAAVRAEIPTLLGLPAPFLDTYPRESVVAEKLHVMATLGMANSRMKDFFDVDFLARHFMFDCKMLTAAVHATFERRRTPIPEEPPTAFTTTFTDDEGKKSQWKAFLRKTGLASDLDLGHV
jgi:hypothetical protein